MEERQALLPLILSEPMLEMADIALEFGGQLLPRELVAREAVDSWSDLALIWAAGVNLASLSSASTSSSDVTLSVLLPGPFKFFLFVLQIYTPRLRMTTTRMTRMRKRIQMINQLGRGELSCLEVASP